MNMKQAEEATGISRRNLRFYEEEGLIAPRRNPDNDYRDYSPEDIERLKTIRMLRMLEVPLEEIKDCLRGKLTPDRLLLRQEKRLQKKQQDAETALRFCRELQKENVSADEMLARMEQPENEGRLSKGWLRDYLKVEEAESLKFFSFTPDEGITNAREFTNALLQYGNRNDLDLVITKEGMYPEFTIDGIAYTAERVYRNMGYTPVPVAVVYCTAQNPELLEPDLPKKKRKVYAGFRNWWPALLILIPDLITCFHWHMSFWEVVLVLASEAALVWAIAWPYRSNRS